ncbi:ATP-dependent 6-phosphofructokinase [Sediminispirochaeta bajacaliforniensis]|uniref:ATP-dependent 6-phosphofructokinase n=1 Tax=Sediminispirochaeta bajacaliforniensis TaxID=148 RepID=UPI00036673FD|nr:ATP-dependent 6-phosphofructokinase [Sediminispirochaeta bajacaliforniensis]
MKIGILTAGGDCPGLNAAIRGVGKAAVLTYGMDVYGISSGFLGMIELEYRNLSELDLSGILTLGGTILGTSREKPFKDQSYGEYIRSKPDIIFDNYKKLGLDCLVCIGGNGTMKTASKLSDYGLNIIGIPKTIDNDVWGTELSFGFDSAMMVATEALDRIHTTANSHKRIMVIEVMGHHAGWLALYSGIAGGGDLILIPEIPYDESVVSDYLTERNRQGKPYSIVVVAEGIDFPKKKKKKKSAANYIAKMIQEETGMPTRETILGYIQRGGSPTAADRILATRFGAQAADFASRGEFGVMVALHDQHVEGIPLSEVAGKLKLVPGDLPLLRKARALGTCFGDTLST